MNKIEMIQSDDYKLAYHVSGMGNTTVIFESGVGDDYDSWIKTGTVSKLIPYANVILYNRSGIDTSEKSNHPPTINKQIKDLDVIMSLVPEGNKVILVGHSMGGAIIRSYSARYPNKISGLVFIDSSHEVSLNIHAPSEGKGFADDFIHWLLDNNYPKDHPKILESLEFENTLEYLKTLGSLPDIAVTVITAKRDGKDPVKEKIWYNAHKNLGKGLSNFVFIESNKSGHYIHQEDPKMVSNAIFEMIDKINV